MSCAIENMQCCVRTFLRKVCNLLIIELEIKKLLDICSDCVQTVNTRG